MICVCIIWSLAGSDKAGGHPDIEERAFWVVYIFRRLLAFDSRILIVKTYLFFLALVQHGVFVSTTIIPAEIVS